MADDDVLTGWHPDPYGRYEERYFINGEPSHLVRSSGIEANDPTGAALAGRPTLFDRVRGVPRWARILVPVVVILLVVGIAVASAGTSGHKTAAPPATTVATTTTHPTTTTVSAALKADRQEHSDIGAIRTMIESQNTAYRMSLTAGLEATAIDNYYVYVGHDTAAACVASWQRNDFGLTDDVFHPETVVATPNWLAPYVGKPEGRVYSFTVDETVTDPSGQVPTAAQTETVHATVTADGLAYGFHDCESVPTIAPQTAPPGTIATLPTFPEVPTGPPATATPTTAAPATTTPTTVLALHDVDYTGEEGAGYPSLHEIDAYYTNSDGTTSEQTGVAKLNVDVGKFTSGSFFDVTVSDASGIPGVGVECTVRIDGKLFMEHGSKGAYSSVDCSGTVP